MEDNGTDPFPRALGANRLGGVTRRRLPASTTSARALRRTMTETETLLWYRLRGRKDGCRYHRQVPVGPYVLDFACRRHRVAIECDGHQHVDNPSDGRRDARLTAKGWRVIRFPNAEILTQIDDVVDMIVAFCTHPDLRPDPPD